MPIVPNFSVAQPLGEPSVLTITDTSTGSDVAITQRRVYLRDAFGNDVLPQNNATEYVEWDYADTSIDINCLLKDTALSITVQWLNVSNVVLYDKVDIVGATSFNEDFAYALTQMLAANPMRINDSGFASNFFNLRLYIDSGNQALERYGDLMIAQLCYDAATNIQSNKSTLFNLVS